jgi:hypothetical protein
MYACEMKIYYYSNVKYFVELNFMSTIHHATFVPTCFHHFYFCTSSFLSLLFFIIVSIPMCHHYSCYWLLLIFLLLHVTIIPILVHCVVLVPTHCRHSYSSCCHYFYALPFVLFLHVAIVIIPTIVLVCCHHSCSYALPSFLLLCITIVHGHHCNVLPLLVIVALVFVH